MSGHILALLLLVINLLLLHFAQIIIHTPVEVPTTINGYIRIPSNQETVIMLKPNMLKTNNGLRTYAPIGRQCYYETERYLRFFRVYTQRNCEMECITNYTVTKCGCSAFYLPSEWTSADGRRRRRSTTHSSLLRRVVS